MSDLTLSLHGTNKGYRIAVSVLFFLQGLCFATWASRIPSIQQSLQLNEATLGIVLFALPAGSLIGLPFSGWLVTKFGSKRVAINALLLYSLLLITIGLSNNIVFIIITLIFFGMSGNIANIAINTQAVSVEEKYGRNIMASFHGLWSLAGFTAAGIGNYMLGQAIIPSHHFLIISAVIMAGVGASFYYLVPDENKNTISAKLFVKPDASLLKLGLIAFCCMLCEGAMFDWSGIYFKKVVQAEDSYIGAGYTAFMCTMATGRFVADKIAAHFGFKRTIQLSGVLMALGLGIAVAFPSLFPAILGFLIVGFGVSSVVPLVYSEAGKSKKVSQGMALAAVSSISFLGFLIGPPLIGVVAGFSSLRISFSIIALVGILVVLIVQISKKRSD
jgi:MFS family permease